MDRDRDRFAMACVLAALCVLGPRGSAHAGTTPDPTELNLVEELVFGASGWTTGDGLFGEIAGAALDSRGAVHILDAGFGCIWKFTTGGQLQLRYGSEGEGPGEFRDPRAIAIGPDDRVYVCGHSPLITIFDADGAPLALHRRDLTTIDSPARSLAVDAKGHVFVCSADVRGHRVIFQYAPADFSLIRSFGDTYAAGLDIDPRAERTFGGGFVAVTAADELLYVQMTPPLIRVHGLDGVLRATIATRGSDTGPPRSEVRDDRFTVFSPDMTATSILGLGDGSIIIAVSEPVPAEERTRPRGFEGTMHVDMYDRSGRLLRSTTRDRIFRPVATDARDRIYVSEYREIDGYDCPVVVRYRIE